MHSIAVGVEDIQVDQSGVSDFYWPISPTDLRTVRDTLLSRVMAVTRETWHDDELAGRVLNIATKHIVPEVLSVYRASTLFRRTQADSGEVTFPGTRLFSALAAEKAPSVPPYLEHLERGLTTSNHRVPDIIRRLIRDLQWNGVSVATIRSAQPERDSMVLPGNELTSIHAESVPTETKYTFLKQWVPNVESESFNTRRERFTDARSRFVRAIRVAFEAAGESLPGYLQTYFSDVLEQTFSAAAAYLEAMTDNPRLPSRLWTGTGGALFVSLLQNAVQISGGQVVAHDHSISSAILDPHLKELVELNSCNQFVTHTAQRAANMRDNVVEKYLAPESATIDSIDVSRPSLFSRLETAIRKPSSRHLDSSGIDGAPDRIMYLMTPYNTERVRLCHNLANTVELDWQARLLDALTNRLNYEVVLKPHPSTGGIPDQLLATFDVDVYTDPFEEVAHRADAYLFDTPRSTTFPFALQTGRPVIFLDFGKVKWADNAREMMKRRCAIASGHIDETNRVRMDWEAVDDAIRRAPALVDNTEFYDTYYNVYK